MFKSVNTHYAAFRDSAEANLAWTGFAPKAWARALSGVDTRGLLDEPLSRTDLRAFCRDHSTTDENAFIACMAWGGMKRDHGRAAWAEREGWLPLVKFLREGTFTREEAYSAFSNRSISGLGPAYFTKLIHFLRPESDGYILDQWTAKSVSLIFTPVFLEITSGGWVDRKNGVDAYRRYCDAVEWIAADLNITGDVAEQMLFSRGGRSKHPWRTYVVKNWSRGVNGPAGRLSDLGSMNGLSAHSTRAP